MQLEAKKKKIRRMLFYHRQRQKSIAARSLSSCGYMLIQFSSWRKGLCNKRQKKDNEDVICTECSEEEGV